MIKSIIDFSLDNRFLVLVLWLLAGVIGVRSMGELPMDAVPDVTTYKCRC